MLRREGTPSIVCFLFFLWKCNSSVDNVIMGLLWESLKCKRNHFCISPEAESSGAFKRGGCVRGTFVLEYPSEAHQPSAHTVPHISVKTQDSCLHNPACRSPTPDVSWEQKGAEEGKHDQGLLKITVFTLA